MVKYTLNHKGQILKDGHTMFVFDILSDLKRKAFLEEERKNNKKLKLCGLDSDSCTDDCNTCEFAGGCKEFGRNTPKT